MFNDVNIDNRLRKPVRGRVIVATTSSVVEHIKPDLSQSTPLFHFDGRPEGFLALFCVEFNGFLTFDQGSEVRMIEDDKPFEAIYYNPNAWRFVKAADAYIPILLSAQIGFSNSENQSAYYDTGIGTWDCIYMNYQVDVNGRQGQQRFLMAQTQPAGQGFDFSTFYKLETGKPYKGKNGYPGLTAID